MKDRIANLLRDGESAARAGKKAEARRSFRTALTLDPSNVPVLLWLAWLDDDPRASLAYIARVLEYDPDDSRAHAALRWARRRATTFESQTPPAPVIPAPHLKERIRNRLFSTSGATKPGFWAILGLLIILVGVTLIWSRPKDTPVSAALAPSPTATATASATPISTPTATLTQAPKPTHTRYPRFSTSTHTPTHTHTPTLPPPTPTPPTPLPSAPPFPPSITPAPLSVSSDDVRWIDVDLTHQLLAAYEGQKLVRITDVSTGRPQTPTPVGQYHIWIKLRYDDMSGADYYLSNVPYVMYFYGGYGLHGTTWHTNFGQPMSHGCVNLPTLEAEWLFNWAEVGTMVNIHY